MNSRREPLLWLQCLAIGAVPLELLLIRLVLSGADPGPVPAVERLLIWSVGSLATAVALWKRPADWGSLLLVRVPTATRSLEQQSLSGLQGTLSRFAALLAAALLLPVLWWLDDSAGLIQEFSPLQGQSRLVTLLLSAPLLALTVWQLQQLIQAVVWLAQGELKQTEESLDQQSLLLERTSLGLQLLRFEPLVWPEPTPESTQDPDPGSTPDADSAVDVEPEQNGASDLDSEPEGWVEAEVAAIAEAEPVQETTDEPGPEPHPTAEPTQDPDPGSTPDADPAVAAEPEQSSEPEPETESEPGANAEDAIESESGGGALAVEPEQSSEEDESPDLNPKVPDRDSSTSGRPEGHREESEASGSEQSEPEGTTETSPGGL